MQKIFVFISAFLFLALPVFALDALSCEPNSHCIVNSNKFISSGQVFHYRSLTISSGVNVVVRPEPVSPDRIGRGGSLTIFTREFYLGGRIIASGNSGGARFGAVDGQTGGTVQVFAKDVLDLEPTGSISANGGMGGLVGCSIGNGGNGGTIDFQIARGAWVVNRSTLTVDGGLQGPVPFPCERPEGRQRGPNGTILFELFTPSANNFSILGSRIRDLPVGSTSFVDVVVYDDFMQPATGSFTWTVDNASIARVVQVNSTRVSVELISPGSVVVTASLDGRAGELQSTVLFNAFSRNATGFNLLGSDSRTLSIGDNSTVEVQLFSDLLGRDVIGFVSWSIDNRLVASIVESNPTTAKITAVAPGLAVLTATLLRPDGSITQRQVRFEVLPAIGRVSLQGDERRVLLSGNSNTLIVDVFDGRGEPRSEFQSSWSTSNSSVVEIVSTEGDSALVRGLKSGTATVTVTVGTLSDSVVYSVQPGRFEKIDVIPSEVLWPAVMNLEYSEIVPASVSPRIIGRDAGGNRVSIPSLQASQIRVQLTRDSIGNLSFAITPPLPPALAPRAVLDDRPPVDGVIEPGSYSYRVTFVGVGGESAAGPASNVVAVVNPAINGRVLLTGIPISSTSGTTARRVYRAQVVDGVVVGSWKFVGSVSGNEVTVFTDNVPNARLGSSASLDVDLLYLQVIAGTKPGLATLRISHGSQQFDVVYNVVMPLRAAHSVRITPSNPTVVAGNSVSFTSFAVDARGNEIPANVEWSVNNYTGSGVITASGVFTALRPGVVYVRGTVPGSAVSSSTMVTVTSGSAYSVAVSGPLTAVAGQSINFVATVKDWQGNALSSFDGEHIEFIWSATSGQVYQNGTFVATRVGTSTVTATLANSPSLAGRRSVTVTPGEIHSLKVVEDGIETPADVPLELNAAWVDRFGNIVTNAVGVSWTVSNLTGSGKLNGNRFTGMKAGQVTVNATLEGNSRFATGVINVVAGQASNFTVKPFTATMRVGDSLRLAAENGFDFYSNGIENLALNWRVSDSSIGVVSTSGTFTALAAGVVTVFATAGTHTETVEVQVLPALRGTSARLSSLPPAVGVASTGSQTTPVVSVRETPSGLSGFFTLAGIGEGDGLMLLVFGLVAVVAALAAYMYFTRSYE